MRFLVSVLSVLGLVGGSCKMDDGPNGAKAPEANLPVAGLSEVGADVTEEELRVAGGDEPVTGPVPPDTSMVFFTVEGALYPLACFDKSRNELLSGDVCQGMVPLGAEVRLSSVDAEYSKTAGPAAEPQCLIGSGSKVGIGIEGINQGADFVFGTWPPSALKIVNSVTDESVGPQSTRLARDEVSKLAAAVAAVGGRAQGSLVAHQVADIDVDGDATREKVYSVYVPHPSQPDQYTWSGIFLAPGGDLDRLQLLDESLTQRDVFEVRATLDMDGDQTAELWIRMVFEEGAGDRIVTLAGGTPRALGSWSCGA